MKDIKFVGLHSHSGVGSPFDGFGYPQEHMDYCFDNGGQALALTDHGNMNGFAYQVLHAKKMKKEGKDFKPIYGVEAYLSLVLKNGENNMKNTKQTKRKPENSKTPSREQMLKKKDLLSQKVRQLIALVI